MRLSDAGRLGRDQGMAGSRSFQGGCPQTVPQSISIQPEIGPSFFEGSFSAKCVDDRGNRLSAPRGIGRTCR